MNIKFTLFIAWIGVFLSASHAYAQVGSQIPIDPESIPQFVDPVPHFAGLRVDATGGNLIIEYVPGSQVAVSTGTPVTGGTVGITPGVGETPVWAYRLSNDGGTTFTPPLWPAFTIETERGIPLNVEYRNMLIGQTYADVNLIADQTLHWADPNGEHGSFAPYEGPVPVVPHLHGGEVPSESDGGPDAWFTPNYAATGPSWGLDGTDQYYYYPNSQEAATLWFHDHALGATRLNVYAGLAGFYFLRGIDEEISHLPGWSGDDLVKEVAPESTSGVFNPEPYLPEIELAFQDRMFDEAGELYFPNDPSNPTYHPFWTPEFIGDVITVNGKTWPYLSVAPRKYRFRLLNGSNARFYELFLTGDNGEEEEGDELSLDIVQIGTDGGLMDSPVTIDGKLVLAPGERADVVIDFSTSSPNQKWILKNTANTPYPDGDVEADPATTGKIMQFVVNGQMVSAKNPVQPGMDKSKVPTKLRTKSIVKLTDFAGKTKVTPDVKRQLTLNEVMANDAPLEALVNNSKWDLNGMDVPGLGETEFPQEGDVELWQIINLTGDAHPIHLHLVQFQVVSRQAFATEGAGSYMEAYEGEFDSGEYEPGVGPPNDYNTPNADGAIGGNPAVSGYLFGPVKPAEPNEQGWKDTHIVYPGEVTTFITRFAPTDLQANKPKNQLVFGFDPSEGPGYVWHCHIIDHEDNEMMRPYKVMSNPARTKSAELEAIVDITPVFGTALGQNYPNPFASETAIPFTASDDTPVELRLFDSSGKLVQILLKDIAPKGNNTVRLYAENLSPGTYFYQLKAGDYVNTKKMVVIE